MVDIHSHIIYNVDDGSTSEEESIKLLEEAANYGVTDIVLTPHFVCQTKFNSDKDSNYPILKNLQSKTNINLYLGNEICVYPDIADDLLSGKTASINNSKYVLIELYKFTIYPNILNIVHELKINGYIPLIAHPERYDSYMFNYNFFNDLIDNGCLLVGNYPSLLGYYGKDAEKMLKYMLKKKMIYALSSDVHRIDNKKYIMLPKVIKKLHHLVGKDYTNDLLIINPMKVINNDN